MASKRDSSSIISNSRKKFKLKKKSSSIAVNIIEAPGKYKPIPAIRRVKLPLITGKTDSTLTGNADDILPESQTLSETLTASQAQVSVFIHNVLI